MSFDYDRSVYGDQFYAASFRRLAGIYVQRMDRHCFFLFLTLVSGIVSSKMRIASIPPVQREMNYSTLAIVKWYVAKISVLRNGRKRIDAVTTK